MEVEAQKPTHCHQEQTLAMARTIRTCTDKAFLWVEPPRSSNQVNGIKDVVTIKFKLAAWQSQLKKCDKTAAVLWLQREISIWNRIMHPDPDWSGNKEYEHGSWKRHCMRDTIINRNCCFHFLLSRFFPELGANFKEIGLADPSSMILLGGKIFVNTVITRFVPRSQRNLMDWFAQPKSMSFIFKRFHWHLFCK